MSLYNLNGQINITSVPGTSFTGLQALDGSYNGVITSGTTWVGLQHKCGAYNIAVVTTPTTYQSSTGALNVVLNGDGTYSPMNPGGKGISSSGGGNTATYYIYGF